MALIEAEGVEKTYSDGTRALRGVSFSITEGEFVAVMGPSGSGKSTLLHILGFLDYQTKGTFRFKGKQMAEYDPEEIARVRNEEMGFIFQMFNLLPKTSVLENVKLPLLYSDVPESQWNRRAKEAIDAVKLSHRTNYDVLRLSGGEKQRVAIARALVNNPSVIFADEPTGNLDSESGRTIMEIIQDLNEVGKTILLITHETYTAEHARRIICFCDGKIESDTRVKKQRRARDHFKK